ncbi:hypothetical protein J437_LFUL019626 [Ladona fulva]|uniref:Uncharacterized protein n=1 Tax=Ladona fulva TaxID=123851 RepID=A0A8K0KTA9_LADFU|nr:hypothetical protein J437_LFUL019626 [Ladona fulva]
MREKHPNLDERKLSTLLSAAYAFLSPESVALSLPDFPADNLPVAANLLETFPAMSVYEALYRLYPYKCFLNQDGQKSVEEILKTFEIFPNTDTASLKAVEVLDSTMGTANVKIGYRSAESHVQSYQKDQLVHDRELQLYDGQRLLRHDRYDAIKEENKLTDEEMAKSGVLRIHPSFRIIALADPPVIGKHPF